MPRGNERDEGWPPAALTALRRWRSFIFDAQRTDSGGVGPRLLDHPTPVRGFTAAPGPRRTDGERRRGIGNANTWRARYRVMAYRRDVRRVVQGAARVEACRHLKKINVSILSTLGTTPSEVIVESGVFLKFERDFRNTPQY